MDSGSALTGGVQDMLAYLAEDDRGAAELHVVDPVARTDVVGARSVIVTAGLQWSPAGDKIACVLDKHDRESLVVMSARQDDASVVSGDIDLGADSQGYLYEYRWSPDGRWLAFAVAEDGEPGDARASVYVADVQSGQHWLGAGDIVLEGRQDRGARTIAWSPTSEWLALSDGGAVHLVSALTGGSQLVALPGEASISSLSWSPDGSKLALYVPTATYDTKCYIYDIASEARRVVAANARPALARWAPERSELLLPSGGVPPFSLSVWREGGDWAMLSTGDYAITEYDWQGIRDRLCVVAEIDGKTYLCGVEPNGNNWQRLTELAGAQWIAPSPGGDRVAFALKDDPEAHGGLYTVNDDGTGLTCVHDACPAGRARWSTSGAELLYEVVDPDQQLADSFIADMSGPYPRIARVNGQIDVRGSAFSASARFVAFRSLAAGPQALAVSSVGQFPWVVSEEALVVAWSGMPQGDE